MSDNVSDIDDAYIAAIWHSALNAYDHDGEGERDDDAAITDLGQSLATLRANITTKADWIEKTINDMAVQDATIATLRKQLDNAREALEPSAATKYCYSGEFKQNITLRDEDGEEYSYPVTIEWTTIKEIMAAINARALKGHKP